MNLHSRLIYLAVFFLLATFGVGLANENIKQLKIEAQKYYWGKNVDQDMGKALELYIKAAELGDGQAQFIAGGMYFKGYGAEVDIQKAFYFLNKAAKNGVSSPDSQEALAKIYLEGNVVPQNFAEAKSLLTKAALGGSSDAQNELGFMYFTGKGVERDFEKSFYWFEKAAQQGLSLAQYNLAMLWYTGNSSNGSNLVNAYAWFNIAASSGHMGAMMAREYLKPLLTEKELTTSQQISSQLYEQINM